MAYRLARAGRLPSMGSRWAAPGHAERSQRALQYPMGDRQPGATRLPPLPSASVSASPETGRLLASTDWGATELGHPDGWPPSLRLAVSICLNSRFPMFVWWGKSLVNIYNDAYVPVLGKRHPHAFGQPARSTWHEIWDVLGPQQRAVMERGEATWNERVLLVMERNGFTEDTWFTWSYSPVYREDGEIGGLFCACTEETGRVLAERERDQLVRDAQTAANALQAWFDNAPGFVALLRGPEHVFELVNKAYHQLVGHRDVVGKPLREALPEVIAQGFPELLDDVRRSGQPFLGHSVVVKLQVEPGGPLAERFLDLVYQPVLDASGAVEGIFAQGHDVTDQVHATAALREADRRKDEFIAILAHELRNPLAPIRQATHIAKLAPPGDTGRRARALDIIERQVTHMTLLIDDLLDLSRISRGKLRLRRERTELATIVDAALESSMPAITGREHQLAVRLPPEPVVMNVDRLRIAQSLSNLLTNAAKYTDPGGTITLEATRLGDGLRICVRDTGIGLSAEDQERLFSMFSQVQTALERADGGLGIGLALTRGLLELHGGRITVQSAGRGQGAEFTITLPLGEVGPTPAPGLPPAASHRASRGLRLLVADDNVDALESLSLLLEGEGHEVHAATDGLQALLQVRTLRPDVAVLDIGMPGLNGFEIAREIRRDPALAGTVLIALTGWGHDEDRARALASGFDHHCTKPVSIDELLALVAAAVGP
jgi:signal transduction histidine kinase